MLNLKDKLKRSGMTVLQYNVAFLPVVYIKIKNYLCWHIVKCCIDIKGSNTVLYEVF